MSRRQPEPRVVHAETRLVIAEKVTRPAFVTLTECTGYWCKFFCYWVPRKLDIVTGDTIFSDEPVCLRWWQHQIKSIWVELFFFLSTYQIVSILITSLFHQAGQFYQVCLKTWLSSNGFINKPKTETTNINHWNQYSQTYYTPAPIFSFCYNTLTSRNTQALESLNSYQHCQYFVAKVLLE